MPLVMRLKWRAIKYIRYCLNIQSLGGQNYGSCDGLQLTVRYRNGIMAEQSV